jgi:drug/metabolite transporter (DMT)-like permease
MPRSGSPWPWIALFIIYTVWGSTYLAIRVVVQELPPFAAAGLRFFAAGLVMAAAAAVVDRKHGLPTRRQLFDYALVGVLLLAGGNALVMWAEKSIPSGIAALIVATVPLWMLLLDGLRPGGEPWTARVWIGTLLGLFGVALVARPEGGVTPGHWAGVIGLTVASLSWTIGSLYAQSLPRKLPLASAAAIEMLAGAIVLFLESRLAGEGLEAFAHASPRAWGGLAYLAVAGSLIGFTAFAYCLDHLPATTVGTYAYVNPVVAVSLGALLLDEPLSPGLLIGGGLILVAVVMTTLRPRRPNAGTPPAPKPSQEAEAPPDSITPRAAAVEA